MAAATTWWTEAVQSEFLRSDSEVANRPHGLQVEHLVDWALQSEANNLWSNDPDLLRLQPGRKVCGLLWRTYSTSRDAPIQ